MKNDFTQARLSLVLLYLGIVGSVIVLFSLLIVYQANDSFSDPAVKTGAGITVTKDQAVEIAQARYPDKRIEETEYEIEDGALYFTTTFGEDEEVKVNLLTRETRIPDTHRSFLTMLTDDFDEMVLWIGLCVFLVAALLCVYVANKTLAPIARNVEKQKRFVSDAAHELRNPLAAMHARIESVLRTPSPHIEKEVLSDVLSETKRLITLSEYLLAFEQNERTGAGSERTLLKKHIETISRLLEPATKDKRITVHIDVENIYVTLSAPDLETVLYNLLHNSVKFTPNGGTITLTQRGNTLTIADSGIGIRKENIPYLFDRFYKGDASRTTDGSGLGLSLVSEILRRYAATIAVESVVGKGTVFTIVFA